MLEANDLPILSDEEVETLGNLFVSNDVWSAYGVTFADYVRAVAATTAYAVSHSQSYLRGTLR